jgi:regulator of cell morphogenesis and NO signaling
VLIRNSFFYLEAFMNLESNITVRQLATEIPGATRLFEKVGIDYCCGGQHSLADACTTAGLRLEEVMASLQKVQSSTNRTDNNFAAMPLADLIDHIVETHHVFTTNEIHRLRHLINKVCSVHGPNHSELGLLRAVFEKLAAELGPHMLKEERVLFPYVVMLEDGLRFSRPVPAPPFVKVANPVRMMMMEHDKAGDLLKEMRQLTASYVPPADACISFRTLYQALEEFEKDLHQHIHLENNILFPKAVELEEKH